MSELGKLRQTNTVEIIKSIFVTLICIEIGVFFETSRDIEKFHKIFEKKFKI
jgi:hypothetical protein